MPDPTTNYAALVRSLHGLTVPECSCRVCRVSNSAAAALEALVRQSAELNVRLDNLLRQLTETSGTT